MTGQELAEALQRLGVGQADLARILTEYSAPGDKVTRTTVWRYVAEKTGIPPGLALAVSLLELMTEDQREPVLAKHRGRRRQRQPEQPEQLAPEQIAVDQLAEARKATGLAGEPVMGRFGYRLGNIIFWPRPDGGWAVKYLFGPDREVVLSTSVVETLTEVAAQALLDGEP